MYYSTGRQKVNSDKTQVWLRYYMMSDSFSIYILHPDNSVEYDTEYGEIGKWGKYRTNLKNRFDLENYAEFLFYL